MRIILAYPRQSTSSERKRPKRRNRGFALVYIIRIPKWQNWAKRGAANSSHSSKSRAAIDSIALQMDFLRERDLLDRLDAVALRGANGVFGKYHQVVGDAGFYADALEIASGDIPLGAQ